MYSIEEAFRECFYIVPDYQREYVWTEKEVLQLLEDINEQSSSGSAKEYFIGTILVSPTEIKNHFEIIDGQQRLTTFFLLLCVLKRLFEGQQQGKTIEGLIATSYTGSDGENCSSLKLEPRYENAKEVMDKIVELGAEPKDLRFGIQAAGISSFGSLERLVNAYETIFQYITDNYSDAATLKKYWGYLANNVVFIQISTDISSALKIFETINERGIGLNPMDLLKNLLFSNVKPEQFEQLKNEWFKITGPLDREKEKPLRFLRYFLMANYTIKNARSDAIVREDEIYDWFIDKDNMPLCDYKSKPFEFVRKVIVNVNSYLAYKKGLGNDGKPNAIMETITILGGKAFSQHYVLLLAASNFPKELFDHFLSQLESFLFYYIFTKSNTRDLERTFSQWADELRTIAQISSALEQREKLNEFVANRFNTNMVSRKQELTDALNRLALGSMQKYRIRYLLARITEHVDMEFKGVYSRSNLSAYTNLQIEHILPATPKEELREKWTTKNAPAIYDEYKNRLGNLTLLEKPINIVAGNNFFSEKLLEYKKSSNYLTRSIAEIAQVGNNTSITRVNAYLKAFTEWNAQSITERQLMLINLIFNIWTTTNIRMP